MDGRRPEIDALVAEVRRLRARVAELEAAARARPADTPAQPRLYRELVEISQGLICKHALDGTLLYTNRASARELGFEPHELVGRNLREGLAPGVGHLLDAYLVRIRRHGTDHGLMRLRTRSGDERVWFYRNQLVAGESEPPYVVGHAIDVTDRIRAEAQLRESDERARAIIAALEEGILLVTADGTTAGCNRSAERILGRPASELVGQPPLGGAWGVVRDDATPMPANEHPVGVTLRTGRPCSRIVMGIRRPDGARVWLEMNTQPLPEPGGERLDGVVASFTDVTARRQWEQERDAALADAIAKLKVLRGLLPICASCKKIRTSSGSWQQLERYIREHSEAEFTHGLCPDCEQRLQAAEARRG
jgi:PAS domain S-box-containing protein